MESETLYVLGSTYEKTAESLQRRYYQQQYTNETNGFQSTKDLTGGNSHQKQAQIPHY
ncbi:MAG: hypothetical protein R2788_13165 [Saprospiraceae bacterium]